MESVEKNNIKDESNEENTNLLLLKSVVDLQERMTNMEEYIDFITEKVFTNERELLELLLNDDRILNSAKEVLKDKINKNIYFMETFSLNEFKKDMENATPDDLNSCNCD